MKIQNKNTSKKKIIGLSLLGGLLLVLLASVLYLYKFNGTLFGWSPIHRDVSSKSINYSPPSKQEVDTGNDIKNTTTTSDNPKTDNSSTDSSVTTDENITISIPSVAVTPDGSTLRITSLIEKLTSNGTCTLSLTKSGSDPITQVVGVQASANSSTCKGFSIPTSGRSGTWQLSITYTDGTFRGNASQSITIE